MNPITTKVGRRVFQTALCLVSTAVLCATLLPGGAVAAESAQGCEHGGRAQYLRNFYQHFAREQAMAVADLLPPEASWHMIGWREDVVPFAGVYSGRAQMRQLFQDYFADIHIRRYEFEFQLSEGDYTTWHYRLIADVPVTGKTFDAEFVHVWQFDGDDRPIFVRSYYDTQLQIDAFTSGGAAMLSDRKNPADDYRVRPTVYDTATLVRTVYDLFYAGDLPGVFGLLSSDAAIYFQGRDNPQSGEYHGIDGILQFILNIAGTARADQIERFQVTEGDRTDVVLFEHWTVFATGKSYHVHTVNSWRVNDAGKLMGFINYPDVDAVATAYVP